MVALTKRFISMLPDKQRIIIHLRDVEGYEFEEIARIIESDETSVRVNLSRARTSSVASAQPKAATGRFWGEDGGLTSYRTASGMPTGERRI
jgi:DNA-directed RNA polymerase specialized sigma24 family protein